LKIDLEKLLSYNQQIHNSPLEFGKVILGLPFHQGQIKWINNSTKRINILRPGNRWGKSAILAVKHIWQCMCKPNLDGKVSSGKEWRKVEYQTLNFGPTYELGRGVLQLARDIVQGNFLLKSGKTNQSLLADWAIEEDRSDAQVLPHIVFKTGARLLGRSYSEMGVAFKMKAIAYLTGDECADIAELWTFTNNTLLPRLVSLDGKIDFAGTPQPEGIDYIRMIEMAEEDMQLPDYTNTGLFYTQKGSMYENIFLPREAIAEIERISDPVMRRQIINGEFVETGEKYFGFERIQNAIDKNLKLQESGYPGRKYITAVDFAGGESAWADFTVIITLDYTEEPYKVVYFNRFKGGDMPIPVQYKMVEDVAMRFGGKGCLIIDNTSLGGRNAMQFLSGMMPISFEVLAKNKGEMLATFKITLDGGQSKKYRRDRVRTDDGLWVEQNKDWGLLRFPDIPVLISELINYKLDDKKIRQDCVMALGMAVHWVEMRRPKPQLRPIQDFDLAAATW